MPSRRMASLVRDPAPASRRAPMSHASASSANAANGYNAFHFVPSARPKLIPDGDPPRTQDQSWSEPAAEISYLAALEMIRPAGFGTIPGRRPGMRRPLPGRRP